MTSFVQPQNREADLQAILENYEDRIAHTFWLIDALQKDGIQNCWDARINDKASDWSCKIFYKKLSKMDVVGIEDSGTFGLTGTIPNDVNDVVKALQSDDPKERLAYFSSSNWSRKAEDALGSRGRGKMVFVGSSENKEIYFDSLRSDDDVYIFGKTYLDENKSISVDILSGEEAEKYRVEVFGEDLNSLTKYGTRILIPLPREEVLDGFQNEKIAEYIQHTWWEILHKYNVNIEIENDGWTKKIEPSPWLPVSKLGVNEMEVYEKDLVLNNNNDLKIKRISLAYIGEKEVPDLYKGIAIQRSGMTIQHLDVSRLIGNPIGDKIIGTVELDKKLENTLRLNEGPEHYSIFWTREIPRNLRLVLKEKVVEFAQKYKLLEDEKKQANIKQRSAEVAIQKELNELAKTLNLSYGTGQQSSKRKKHIRTEEEQLRLSIPDFETPFENGRVNYGQKLNSLYAVPFNSSGQNLKVLLKIYIIHNDIKFKKESAELSIEQEIDLDENTDIKVGWDEMLIDENFPPGEYTLRARLLSMEDRKIDDKLSFEKGDEIYKIINRKFYVEEEPKDNGLFKLQRVQSDDKKKYFWWELEDRTWVIYWNGNHPSFKNVIDDEELLQIELRKMSFMIFFSILCTEDNISLEENKKPKLFSTLELKDSNFDELLQTILSKQSELLWNKF